MQKPLELPPTLSTPAEPVSITPRADEPRKLTNIPETQTRLGDISRTTLYELVKSGELVQVHIGRRSFITSDSIDRLIETLSAKAQPMEAA